MLINFRRQMPLVNEQVLTQHQRSVHKTWRNSKSENTGKRRREYSLIHDVQIIDVHSKHNRDKVPPLLQDYIQFYWR